MVIIDGLKTQKQILERLGIYLTSALLIVVMLAQVQSKNGINYFESTFRQTFVIFVLLTLVAAHVAELSRWMLPWIFRVFVLLLAFGVAAISLMLQMNSYVFYALERYPP